MNTMGMGKKAIIHYLFHSGFTVEYGDYLMIFDYYKPPDSTSISEITEKDIINKIKEHKYPFVFVSHSHYDHYNPEIFNWREYNPSLTYILSNDIKQVGDEAAKHQEADYIYMSAYENMEVNGVDVSTFGSTDIGVSFLIKIGDLRIFHAGDLNWWHWADESTQQELEEEEKKFKEEVAGIGQESIDIMFFPVDHRLGEHYWMGGAYMLETFTPGLFLPMHFGDNNEITQRFAKRMKALDVPIAEITHKGQRFEFHL